MVDERQSDRRRKGAGANAVYWNQGESGMSIRLVGEIDSTNNKELVEALAVVERNPTGVTIDLQDADSVDSNTLGVFAVLHSHGQAIGKPLVLYKPQRAVLMVLEMVGFDGVMQVIPAE